MEKKQIFESIAKIEKYYGKVLEPEVRNMYVDRLSFLSTAEVQSAMVRTIDEFVPTSATQFPLISHILSYCGLDGNTKAINVVSVVKDACVRYGQYQSVDFGDRAIHSVIERYGGWQEVVLWGEDQWQFHERNFIAAYKAAKNANIGPSHCPGVFEIENKINGQKVEPPVLVYGQKTVGKIENRQENSPETTTHIGDLVNNLIKGVT